MPRKPKFTAVAAALQERIEAGAYPAGRPLPPETKLAEAFDVNRLTLRKAIDRLAAQGLLQRQPGRGTYVTAAEPQRNTVLLLGTLAEHFYQPVHAALRAEAQARGLALTAFEPDDAAALEGHLATARALLCAEVGDWVFEALPADLPAVRIADFIGLERQQAPAMPTVSTDPMRAAREAVLHLAALGHERIGVVDTARTVADPTRIQTSRGAVQGYHAGLVAADLQRHWHVPLHPRAFEMPDANLHTLRDRLAGQDELPSAFVCCGDFRAAPLVQALAERGLRVPRDVSIVGMGDTPWAAGLLPPLTTMSLNEAGLARLAMRLMDADAPAELYYVAPRLVERQSTAPPVS